ncbi:MAG: hypothetical protein H6981_01795 [Gammaproteobacteria bacterium]|nr:hypothetical protein [Gammaproteobacteria bacterium]MCP5135521.1 hypothetical protein [Gammaproteobacteria bacterium]
MTAKTLLSIVEIGGYPDMTPIYTSAGFRIISSNNQRKALKLFRDEKPDVIVSEFIFQPDYRDRYCNVGTLTSQFPIINPEVKLILLYEEEDAPALSRFTRDFAPYHAALPHPVDRNQLAEILDAMS